MSPTTAAICSLTVAVAVSLLLARRVDKIAPPNRKRWRLGVAILLTLLCLPGLWFSAYYLHIFPETKLLYDLRAQPLSEWWLALFLPAAVAWSTFVPRVIAVAAYGIAIAGMLPPFIKPILRPLDQTKLAGRWIDDACIQSTESTCGPASAATVLRFLGDKTATERDLARRGWSTASGTEAWHLARALRRRGRTVDFEFKGLPSPDHLPGVMGMSVAGNGHFVALLKCEGDQWTIADPLVGMEVISRQDLEKREISPFFMRIR
ncbi:MAG: cysteine peptidase family C39 domain-containing protein [Luteolibacter sp.]